MLNIYPLQNPLFDYVKRQFTANLQVVDRLVKVKEKHR